MKSKYTSHQLSPAACSLLSMIVHERDTQRFGQALAKLERAGLVEKFRDAPYPGRTHRATQDGRQALAQARREGF